MTEHEKIDHYGGLSRNPWLSVSQWAGTGLLFLLLYVSNGVDSGPMSVMLSVAILTAITIGVWLLGYRSGYQQRRIDVADAAEREERGTKTEAAAPDAGTDAGLREFAGKVSELIGQAEQKH
jgi:hypothetical protein